MTEVVITPGTAAGPAAEATAQRVLRADVAFLPGRGFVRDVSVVIADGRIAAVHEGDVSASDGEPVTVLAGKTLIPGLIDSHVHLTFSGSAAVLEDVTDASDLALAMLAVHNAQLALARGVTTVADCGARGAVAIVARDAVASGRFLGPRILASGAPITTTAGHCSWLGACADSADEVIREARRQVAAGADFIKLMLTGGNLTPRSNPNMLQYPPDVVAALAQEARRLGRPLVVHAHSEEAVALAGRVGADVVAHGTCASENGIGLSPDTIAALLAGKTAIDATITVGMAEGGDLAAPSSERAQIRKEMLPVFAALHAAGVPILAGTDAGVTAVAHGRSARAVAALEAEVGLSRVEALAAATERAAAVLGLSGVTGAIAPGLSADLVVLDGDLAQDATAILRPAQVYAAGVLVAAQGSLLIEPGGAAT